MGPDFIQTRLKESTEREPIFKREPPTDMQKRNRTAVHRGKSQSGGSEKSSRPISEERGRLFAILCERIHLHDGKRKGEKEGKDVFFHGAVFHC